MPLEQHSDSSSNVVDIRKAHQQPLYTCRQLGVCQMRNPPCRLECRTPRMEFYFAPGTIDPPPAETTARERLQVWLAVATLALIFAASLVAGLRSGALGLLEWLK